MLFPKDNRKGALSLDFKGPYLWGCLIVFLLPPPSDYLVTSSAINNITRWMLAKLFPKDNGKGALSLDFKGPYLWGCLIVFLLPPPRDSLVTSSAINNITRWMLVKLFPKDNGKGALSLDFKGPYLWGWYVKPE
ncbi:hypothetical protein CDAR_292871 [Caerostris darwini]|uniref:Uncharacterized protein n=1 Tax=Caerostris darwini TaxID=1538125 RepID=A0AAV4T574_9ARAC|nr:hypothetical protein CDAR_292871 [Caerostris darwini]